MLNQRFLSGLMILVLCSSMVFDSIAEPTVTQMTELLSYPGWRGLPPLEIVDVSGRYKINEVLGDDTAGPIKITVQSAVLKVRQVQLLLSCQYTIDFLIYQTYLYRLGTACTFMDSSIQQECLQKFMELLNPETFVSRMQGALSFFSFLTRETELKTAFFDILEEFSNLYEPFSLPNVGADVVINYKLDKIIMEFCRLEIIAINFFKNFCGPAALLKEKFGDSKLSTVDVKLNEIYFKAISHVDKMGIIYPLIKNAIKEFLEMDYLLLGFKTESKATVLNEITDSKSRVHQIKMILKEPGWALYLHHLKIIRGNTQYGVKNLFH
ncbi:uncharacterized protein LOC126845010 [Adelges cooleyi]|uniref:uncharacterized protein LOC126845010 n=1 Tax=Adelges cooleyi TaxID=133065 RepID=UPI0021808E2A|nr:uncharacterized protein LOC126845010 [Adelges cooleyi]